LIDIRVDPWPDEADLDALFRAAWGDDVRPGYRKVLERSLAHLCAYDGERLVGFVNVASDGGIHAFILDTSVHPDHRRNGIGTRLVRAAADAARNRGAAWLHADYEPPYAGLYEACGFRPTSAGVMRLR
jgi:GNAT superfamily N-acetyltransferase